ncbi:5-formyltetrahydrofolate cyclo-ligase [Mammaliicoccus sp. Dog046]|uniref:5-formyltetrahydrofolate cyclo-ligase n=1 Tax=Mammaliicoccus sp. Dog046 TaxID=3034233 RepID=UPI002B25802D|nr:5-formyltetrahydrofolate cyclo-ligase [Mammaliicoccus sp. Dog046]WQK86610.1 5-formyltetrahydrofolate cyclo-ligase [Mammaliicoccus sp. Dog046]
MNEKKTLRNNILTKMKELNLNSKHKYDLNLRQQLFNHNKYKQANRVAIVMSMDHEVDTLPIIKQMLKENKKVYVPQTDYEKKNMVFQRLINLDTISKDEKGIKYINDKTEVCDDLDLIIVPGVIYRKDGYRIGYGGGYYDKYLSQYEGDTLSLAYKFQVQHFEIEEHDVPVDEILIAKEIDGEL